MMPKKIEPAMKINTRFSSPSQLTNESVVMGFPVSAWNKALTGNFVQTLKADIARAAAIQSTNDDELELVELTKALRISTEEAKASIATGLNTVTEALKLAVTPVRREHEGQGSAQE